MKQKEIFSRAQTWFEMLVGRRPPTADAGSVWVADKTLGKDLARFISVIPDSNNRFPRARGGELGLEEAWHIARRVYEVIAVDGDSYRRPIIAIVDIPGQAYGLHEEALGIHLACASATNAYATARIKGHPVISLVVGCALSGAFLAHGYQANRILAIDSPDIMVHAMGKSAAARITRSSVAELDKLADEVIPMSYDLHRYAELGMLYRLIKLLNADIPSPDDVDTVRRELVDAIEDTRSGPRDLSTRLTSVGALKNRTASIQVRRLLADQW